MLKVLGWASAAIADRSRPAARIPDGLRVYVMGDVHGRADLFEALLAQIDDDHGARPPADRLLVMLGDLIDRGPDSAAVVERAFRLQESGVPSRFLMGNHEEVFLKAASRDGRALKYLIKIGGRPTLLSYGITEAEYDALNYDELATRLAAVVPREHLEFIGAFEDQIEIGDYLFVHAGVRPGLALKEQRPSDLRWIRDVFLRDERHHGRVVVHGHSISDRIEIRHNRIGLDTGAFATGVLSAIGIENEHVWSLATIPPRSIAGNLLADAR